MASPIKKRSKRQVAKDKKNLAKLAREFPKGSSVKAAVRDFRGSGGRS